MKKKNLSAGIYAQVMLSLLAITTVLVADAQHTDLVDSSQVQVLADTSKSYFIPDLQRKHKSWNQFSTKWFTIQLGFAPIFDYTFFIQDDNSKQQVGKQNNQFDLRSGRFSVRGKLLFKNPWTYLVSAEYHGFDRDRDDKPFGFTDIQLVIPFGNNVKLNLGKLKENFTYEMTGDAANLPHMERILSPFFVSRNLGMTLRGTALRQRMTWTAGWYNDWWAKGESFSESANTFTARVTTLPLYVEASRFVHVGAGMRYVQSENGVLRMRGRNESNVSDYYVDTKDITADHALNLNMEQLWSLENFSMLVEYTHSWVNTPVRNEQFNGFYVTGSWVISGEQRPYDRIAGYARRIKPDGRGGAWEIVGRVSRVDLTNKQIDGGLLRKMMLGLNWWATQYWKVGFAYGVSNLEKNSMQGITNSFQFRLQWIY